MISKYTRTSALARFGSRPKALGRWPEMRNEVPALAGVEAWAHRDHSADRRDVLSARHLHAGVAGYATAGCSQGRFAEGTGAADVRGSTVDARGRSHEHGLFESTARASRSGGSRRQAASQTGPERNHCRGP